MKSKQETTSSQKSISSTSPQSRPSLLRSVFSISSLQHHISLSSDTVLAPIRPKTVSAPTTPIPKAPPSKEDENLPIDNMSETATDYFVPEVISPVSTPGRRIVPFAPTTTPKTLGIDWRYGAQGTSLLVNAAEESRRSGHGTYSTNFERSTYITGLQNLLNGLPPDLRDAEISTLQHAIPPAVVTKIVQQENISNNPEGFNGTRDNKNNKHNSHSNGTYKENLLHKFLLWFFIFIDGWVWFLWPKIFCLYVRIKQLGQDHGQEVAGSLGRGALSVAGGLVYVANQEPVMEAAQAISRWFYEGVSGAVADFVAMKVAERGGLGNKIGRAVGEEGGEGGQDR
ncbi:hypothetical protein B0T20DRAFT_350324 [Sordaria brevicollis]|uniref:Uncharacterized protein n=1 Tax=Sordaria brevicollis TaxID=83679 RepID=A0AAE0PHV3_SORBR|nr:hypothetical protein B0T20DRAFT_350324 [Sordaria brevicollis]